MAANILASIYEVRNKVVIHADAAGTVRMLRSVEHNEIFLCY